jgi:hypothetical protein
VFAPDPPDVPYGSNMLMPIFYLGILGAVVGAMVDLASKNRLSQAAVTGIVGGGITGKIILSYWLDGSYPLFHYSNVIILMPVAIVSGLVVLFGIALVIRLAISKCCAQIIGSKKTDKIY